MNISLEVHDQHLPRVSLREYDEENDVRSLLIDICEALANSGAVLFRVSGFGQDSWPVDVLTDLPVLLEQLPAAIEASSSVSRFTLDFYEQGIQRRLIFVPDNGDFSVRCESDANWKPSPGPERIAATDLRETLLSVKESFLRVVRAVAPEIADHKWLRAWAAE